MGGERELEQSSQRVFEGASTGTGVGGLKEDASRPVRQSFFNHSLCLPLFLFRQSLPLSVYHVYSCHSQPAGQTIGLLTDQLVSAISGLEPCVCSLSV